MLRHSRFNATGFNNLSTPCSYGLGPTIPRMKSTEVEDPLVDIGTDETGFNFLNGPSATRQCKLFASRVGTDESVIGNLLGGNH